MEINFITQIQNVEQRNMENQKYITKLEARTSEKVQIWRYILYNEKDMIVM